MRPRLMSAIVPSVPCDWLAALGYIRGDLICFKFHERVSTIGSLTKERNMRGQTHFLAGAVGSFLLAAPLFAQTSPITTGTLQTNLFRTANIPIATQGEPIDLV